MNCRFRVKREAGFLIEGQSKELVSLEIEVIEEGEFEFQLHVFVADPQTRELVLSIKGHTLLTPALSP